MKNLITFIMLAVGGFTTSVFGQEKSQEIVITEQPEKSDFKNLLYKESTVIYTMVDKSPEFIGGFLALSNFFKKNLKTGGETGRVVATFVIEKDGSLSNVEVVRSFSETAKREVLRVMKFMPKWKPGMNNNRVVRTQFSIPIAFN